MNIVCYFEYQSCKCSNFTLYKDDVYELPISSKKYEFIYSIYDLTQFHQM